RVLHQRIHAEMNALNRLATRCDHMKCRIELREIFRLDDDVPLTDRGGTESQFPARQAPALDLLLGPQVIEIVRYGLAEGGIAHARLEVTPDVIEVHAASRPTQEWTQNVQAANEDV